jgi:predicted nucleic acid-binding protein
MICADSSVAAEEYSAQARALLPSEVANVIRQRLRQGPVRLDKARAPLAQLLVLPIRLQAPQTLYDRVLVLAAEFNLPVVYDTHYVALAQAARRDAVDGRPAAAPRPWRQAALRALDRRPQTCG